MRREKKVSGRWRKMKRMSTASLNGEVTFHALSESANSTALWNPDADSARTKTIHTIDST